MLMSSRKDPDRNSDKVKPKGSSEKSQQPQVGKPNLPSPSTTVPVELQQLLLNIFKTAFSESFNSKSSAVIQQIKRHLFNRDFHKAFDSQDLREAYATRWSPSRALAYTHILYNLAPVTTRLLSVTALDPATIGQSRTHQPHNALANVQPTGANALSLGCKDNRFVCVGAGAGAEIAALGGCLSLMNRHALNAQTSVARNENPDDRSLQFGLKVSIVDIADWNSVLCRLQSNITAAPPLSQYASDEAKAANTALIEADTLVLEFIKQDVLTMTTDQMPVLFADASLVTFMFTLNELYATSMSATTNLLLSLTMLLSPNTLLLVVDSPGSYSTIALGQTSDPGEEAMRKRYPMQWLLDHTLIEAASVGSSNNASGQRQWEKLETQGSEWFRLSSELRYPIELEDMRYQMHLYRRL